jgi:hypothetical protein
MFAFILGTSPLFFSVSYFATRIGATMEKYFTRIAAVTMLLLALVSIDAGLNLIGSPFSFSRSYNTVVAAANLPGLQSGNGFAMNGYAIHVSENGYSPAVLHLPADKAISLEWVTENTQACSRSVVIPGLSYQKILPPTGRVRLEIPAQPRGTVLRYTCSMGMYPSQLVFDLDS